MKYLVILFVAGAMALTIEDQWAEFKVTNNRNYSDEEDKERFEIFKAKVQEINEHNEKFEKGEVTWSMAINDFTDKKPEELQQFYGALPPKEESESNESNESEEETTIEAKWENYKNKHMRKYDAAENDMRFKLFQNSLKTIEAHNAKYERGEVTFKMGLNQFSDRTTGELKKMHGKISTD